jgi:hypothetical protein
MLQKVVVVAPLSPSNQCHFCGSIQIDDNVVCLDCNRVQPISEPPPSFFHLFNLEPSLEIDEELLRTRFYQLSQKTHPDTQMTKDLSDQLQAGRWST